MEDKASDRWQQILPFGVREGHEGKEVDGMENSHVQVFSRHSSEKGHLDGIQPVQVVCLGVRLVGQGANDELQRTRGEGWLGNTLLQDLLEKSRGQGRPHLLEYTMWDVQDTEANALGKHHGV